MRQRWVAIAERKEETTKIARYAHAPDGLQFPIAAGWARTGLCTGRVSFISADEMHRVAQFFFPEMKWSKQSVPPCLVGRLRLPDPIIRTIDLTCSPTGGRDFPSDQ